MKFAVCKDTDDRLNSLWNTLWNDIEDVASVTVVVFPWPLEIFNNVYYELDEYKSYKKTV